MQRHRRVEPLRPRASQKRPTPEAPRILSDGTRRVELYNFDWGHTRGDTLVYVPKEQILCVGDAVGNGAYSDSKYAYMGHWAEEIRGARKLKVKTVHFSKASLSYLSLLLSSSPLTV